MKKIIYILLIMFVLLTMKVEASAKHLEIEYQKGIYYTRRIDGKYSSYLFPKYLLGREVVYCIEPGYEIYNYEYTEDSWNNINLENEKKKMLSLIGYYGYEYKNHDDIRYLLATQELIWETLNVKQIEFYTKRYGYGDKIDVEDYKNEIINLINKHDLKPNLDTSLKLYLNKEVVLEDSNKVLDEFEVINNKDVVIKNNKLIIKPTNDLKEIILRKKRYDNKKNIMYSSLDNKSQKLAKLRYMNDVELKIKVEVLSGEFSLEKLDYDSKSNKVITNTSLANAKYGIYDINKNLIKIITTDEFGKCYLNNLELGTYLLKELEASFGYELDPTIYKFVIDENNLKVNLKVYEKLIKKQVKVEKIDSSTNTKINIKGIKFKIKDLTRNIYLDKIYVTNELGEFETELLPLGEYELIELDQMIPGYRVNPKPLKFEIKDKNLNLKFSNEKITGYLKIIKVNKVTSIPLKGVKFIIYNLDDELITEVITNDNGIIEVPLLYGSYYLIEKETLDGYVLDNNKYYFEIDKDLETKEIVLTNEMIEVPRTSLDRSNILKFISIIIFFLGSSLIFRYYFKHIQFNN